MFPKIGVPPNHPFVHRVFYYFHHPFWGTIIFRNTHMEFSAKSRKTALQSHPSGPNVKKQLSSIPASVFSQKIAQLAFIWSHKQTNMLQFMTDFCHLYNYIIYWYILHFIIGYCRSRAYRPPLTLESLRCFLLNSAPRGLAQW